MPTHDEILEIAKNLTDLFKQMTTLTSGMIAVIITMVEKVLPKDLFTKAWNKFIFALILTFLTLSLGFSMVALLGIPANTLAMLKGEDVKNWVSDNVFYSSVIFFISGIALFTLFSAVNLFVSKQKSDHQTRDSKRDENNHTGVSE